MRQEWRDLERNPAIKAIRAVVSRPKQVRCARDVLKSKFKEELFPSASVPQAIADFAREDYVEEAWRIVDPILRDLTPILEYNPNTWGPVGDSVTPPGGWHNPAIRKGEAHRPAQPTP